MIRKTTNGDISDDEFEAVLKPFLDDYDNFVYSYVMPEIIAYYIANSFNRNQCILVHLINIIILLKICLIYLTKIMRLLKLKCLNY